MQKLLYYLKHKHFLATAATLALVIPAVKAETHWLVLMFNDVRSSSTVKVEMASAAACREEGRRWEESPTHGFKSETRRFHCVIGK